LSYLRDDHWIQEESNSVGVAKYTTLGSLHTHKAFNTRTFCLIDIFQAKPQNNVPFNFLLPVYQVGPREVRFSRAAADWLAPKPATVWQL
jgi:hypothetical protein